IKRIENQFRQAGGSDIIVNIDSEHGVVSGNDEAKYYGAYLWIVFAICDDTKQNPRQKALPAWRNILPYFVHGNIAEKNSYEHVSQLVAAAAARGALLLKKKCPHLKLHYVSTIDHSNCGDKLLKGSGQSPILERLLRIKALPGYDEQLSNLILPV